MITTESEKSVADRLNLVSVPVLRGLGMVAPLLSMIDGFGWVAGGFARWCCSTSDEPAEATDLDIFVGSQHHFNALFDQLRGRHAQKVKENDYYVEWDVSGVFPGYDLPHVQLIKPFYDGSEKQSWGPTRADVIDQIDLTVCRIALDGLRVDGTVKEYATADACFSADERNKRISFKRFKDPVLEMKHAFKYAAKGYTIDGDAALDLLENWASRPETERAERRKKQSDRSDTY